MFTNSLIRALWNETIMIKPNETERQTHRGEAQEKMGLKMINLACEDRLQRCSPREWKY